MSTCQCWFLVENSLITTAGHSHPTVASSGHPARAAHPATAAAMPAALLLARHSMPRLRRRCREHSPRRGRVLSSAAPGSVPDDGLAPPAVLPAQHGRARLRDGQVEGVALPTGRDHPAPRGVVDGLRPGLGARGPAPDLLALEHHELERPVAVEVPDERLRERVLALEPLRAEEVVR